MSTQPALTPMETEMLMRFALGEAERGLRDGELPIGCVVVIPGDHGLRIVGRGHEVSSSGTPAHAVTMALAGVLEKRRPGDLGFVVVATVQPCDDCMAALQGLPVHQLVYGLPLPSGSGERRVTAGKVSRDSLLCVSGVRTSDCRDLLDSFATSGARDPRAVALAEKILRRPSLRTHAA